jgi:hypothetical protein
LQTDIELSFESWKDTDDLPAYEDHVNGFTLAPPSNSSEADTDNRDQSWPQYQPSDAAFGGLSCVKVPVPEEILESKQDKATDQL